ncbi:hypothetical protein [Actinoplanes lobatus]|uniref:Uncharacterized protein n=1 Tax=Actinoplanes lobatus TaxID=113568 RepID=A0A7W7HL21_9ACTN|nr:hypothetical protein [Actinoplanes lobatus]MBB4752197.1 hypothetical protein [Actinoplanes lobatus]
MAAQVVVVAAGCHTPALLPSFPATRTRRIRYGFFTDRHPRCPAVVDLVTGTWGRPQADGEHAGGLPHGGAVPEWDDTVDGGTRLTREQQDHIRDQAGQRLPWLADAACLGGRYGTDLYHPDGPLSWAGCQECRTSWWLPPGRAAVSRPRRPPPNGSPGSSPPD